MASLGAAWDEGYKTALRDFNIEVTGKDLEERVTRCPHGDNIDRTGLTEYEKFELRNALGYHFEDCPGEWDLQTEIVVAVVGRILSRRPDRTA